MVPDQASYGAVGLVTKHGDDQVCATQTDFMVPNVPPSKITDLVEWLDTLGRIPCGRSLGL